MKIVKISIALFMLLVYMNSSFAGITCVRNSNTGIFEAKNSTDTKANEECKKRGEMLGMEPSKMDGSKMPDSEVEKSSNKSPVVSTLITSKGDSTDSAKGESTKVDRSEWDMKEHDVNMRLLIQRWGSESSPAWKLKWEFEKDIPLGGEFSIKEMGFKNAVLYVTSLSSQSGVRVKPCFHSNNVVRVISASAVCKLDSLQKGTAQ